MPLRLPGQPPALNTSPRIHDIYTITTRSIEKQTVFQSSSEYREHTHINILILRRWEQQSGIPANSASVRFVSNRQQSSAIVSNRQQSSAICQECVGNRLQVGIRYAEDIY